MNKLIAKSEIENEIYALIDPTICGMGFMVIRVLYINSEPATLQIMVERKTGGIEITDCTKISKTISALLDVNDPIDQKYNLEISSPGINRPLTRWNDFETWEGYGVKIKTHESIGNRKKFNGLLRGTSDKEILLEISEGVIGIHQEWGAEATLSLTNEQIMNFNTEVKTLNDKHFDHIETE